MLATEIEADNENWIFRRRHYGGSPLELGTVEHFDVNNSSTGGQESFLVLFGTNVAQPNNPN